VQAAAPSRAVYGSDGREHIDYDLVTTNAFTAPVTLKSLRVRGDGKTLLTLKGNALAAKTFQNFGSTPRLSSSSGQPSCRSSTSHCPAPRAGRRPSDSRTASGTRCPRPPRPGPRSEAGSSACPDNRPDPSTPDQVAAARLRLVRRQRLLRRSDGAPSQSAPARERRLLHSRDLRDRLDPRGQQLLLQRRRLAGHGLARLRNPDPRGRGRHRRHGGQRPTPGPAAHHAREQPHPPQARGFRGQQHGGDDRPAPVRHIRAHAAWVGPSQAGAASTDRAADRPAGQRGNSTGPHLHFGIYDGLGPLTSNSVPFEIKRYRFQGNAGGNTPVRSPSPASRAANAARSR
jgi:hypothetical protein